MKKIVLAFALILAGSFAAPAFADSDGYVCKVQYEGVQGPSGYFGNIIVTVNSLASCGGTTMGPYIVCSYGATASTCDTAYLYSEAQLIAFFRALRDAGQTNQKIHTYLSVSKTTYLKWVDFVAP